MSFRSDPCNTKQYVEKRLNANEICKVMDQSREEISPAMYALLLKRQPTTCAAELCFSMLNKLIGL